MSQLFKKGGRQAFGSGSAFFTAAGTYVPYLIGSMNAGLLDTAVFLSDIPVGVYRARGTYMTTKSITDGIADADDSLIDPVASSAATVLAIVLVQEAGAPVSSAVSLVVHYGDVASVLPFSPNGGGVQIQWDNGANKIFVL